MRSLDKRRKDYFTPDVPPKEADSLPDYLFNQLTNMSATFANVNSLHLNRVTHLPDRFKPREGDIMLSAEGVLGVSAGMYYFDGEQWVFIA